MTNKEFMEKSTNYLDGVCLDIFKQIIDVCLRGRFTFEVGTTDILEEGDTFIEYIARRGFTGNQRYIHIWVSGDEYLVTDNDLAKLSELYSEVIAMYRDLEPEEEEE